jgi:hypothetical protein
MARPKLPITDEERAERIREQKRCYYHRRMQQEGAREEWRLKGAESMRRTRAKRKELPKS